MVALHWIGGDLAPSFGPGNVIRQQRLGLCLLHRRSFSPLLHVVKNVIDVAHCLARGCRFHPSSVRSRSWYSRTSFFLRKSLPYSSFRSETKFLITFRVNLNDSEAAKKYHRVDPWGDPQQSLEASPASPSHFLFYSWTAPL